MSSKSSIYRHDAMEMLIRDHDAIRQLFWDYERLVKRGGEPERKAEVMARIGSRLSMHMQIEDEIFYPAVQIAIHAQREVAIALKSHVTFDHVDERLLIARLDEMDSHEADYDATVADLGAHVAPHIYNEEQNLFPAIRMSRLDTLALGREMALRRNVLQADVTRVGVGTQALATWPTVHNVAGDTALRSWEG